MKKYLTYIAVIIVLNVFSTETALAQEVAGASAELKTKAATSSAFDYRVQNLESFLTHMGSPLADFAPDFVTLADLYGIDYRLVPSIAGVESTFGKQIPANSYNAYGWVNGNYSFKSWSESIQVVTSTLKANYIDRGLASIYQIARVYAPPSTTWGGKVSYFMNKIDAVPLNFDII